MLYRNKNGVLAGKNGVCLASVADRSDLKRLVNTCLFFQPLSSLLTLQKKLGSGCLKMMGVGGRREHSKLKL